MIDYFLIIICLTIFCVLSKDSTINKFLLYKKHTKLNQEWIDKLQLQVKEAEEKDGILTLKIEYRLPKEKELE